MVDAKVREAAPGVFVVHLPLPMKPTIVNVTLLDGGGEWALVDTGLHTADSIDTLKAALAQLGVAPERVRTIIGTHHHPDHYGASRALKEFTGATVYLHELEFNALAHYAPDRKSDVAHAFFRQHGLPLDRFASIPTPGQMWAQVFAPVTPEHFLHDGDVVGIGDLELTVMTTPGHTAGHCVLHLRKRGILIVGDHLLPKITPHVGLFPGGPENPLADFLDSQEKIQPLEVDLVLPAHGGTFADHRHRAQQIIQHHHFRLREILDVTRRRPLPAYDIAAQAFGFDAESPFGVQFAATFETLAHLEYLRAEGQVQREAHDERLEYRAA